MVVRIDRLARSTSHLLQVIEALHAKGAGFRSLSAPIDTGSPQGKIALQILASVTELEISLIRERTIAGLAAARKQGRIGGNPGLRSGSRAAIHAVTSARDRRRDDDLLRIADKILPALREMRPACSWDVVARHLHRHGSRRPDGGQWTGPALSRAARRLESNGFVGAAVLERKPRQRDNEDLVTLVAMAAKTLPNPTHEAIAKHLEGLHVRTAAAQHFFCKFHQAACFGSGRITLSS